MPRYSQLKSCSAPIPCQVIVFKYKPKKHYRRTNGHRQPLTKILVSAWASQCNSVCSELCRSSGYSAGA